ncbi:hypothetical protein L5515_002414 [Caenorhabditis briggsae]|uniref:Uncharacterized protein n=1 Tax=Caenorhabditis briggsae TaxID=6238 RepID=A0AAE9E8F2_CAEBR|nr:hypothetical protein L5515_002414 [Caenorhabditis briggsae]
MNIFRWICNFDNKLFVVTALIYLFIEETCYRYPRGQKEIADRRNPPVKGFVITKKDDPQEVTFSELLGSSSSGKTSFEKFAQLVFGENQQPPGTTPAEGSTESPTSLDSEEIPPIPSSNPWVLTRIKNRIIVYSYVLCGRRCDQLGIENITSTCDSAHSITKKLVREVCCPHYNPSEKLIIQKVFSTVGQIIHDLFYGDYGTSEASELLKSPPEGKVNEKAQDQTQDLVIEKKRSCQKAREPSTSCGIAHPIQMEAAGPVLDQCSYVAVEESHEPSSKSYGFLTANSAVPQPHIPPKLDLEQIIMSNFRATWP